MVSSATLTTIIIDVPPIDMPAAAATGDTALTMIGDIATIARYNAPNKVILVRTF